MTNVLVARELVQPKKEVWLERSRAYFAGVTERQKHLSRALGAQLASTTTELTWEVGSGHGHYLTAYAAAHPQKICIGIDLLRDRVARAERKRVRARLVNLHFFQAEATEFLRALPPTVMLSDVFVLFPDPWPKRRHHKNRIMRRDFLQALAARAGQGARLFFRTDHAEYFRAAVRVIENDSGWLISSDATWPFELPTVFQQKARTYYSVVATRAETPP